MTADCAVLEMECIADERRSGVSIWPVGRGRGLVESRKWTSARSLALVRGESKVLAELFNAVRSHLFSVAVRSFVEAASTLDEVEEIVLFDDAEGTHVWTLMGSREYDAETALLEAEMALEDRWPAGGIDVFSVTCSQDEFEARLPQGFVRLYVSPSNE